MCAVRGEMTVEQHSGNYIYHLLCVTMALWEWQLDSTVVIIYTTCCVSLWPYGNGSWTAQW